MLTPLTDWIETIACAIRPSRRSAQEMCEPRPGTSPQARTSKVPPRLSFSLRSRLTSSTIAAEAAGSRQRTGSSSTPSKSSGPRSSGAGRLDARDPGHVGADRHPYRGEELAREGAGGYASGGLARARALEHVARVLEAVLLEARRGRRGRAAAGGPARRPRRSPTGPSARSSSRSRGWRPAARPGCPGCGRGARPSGPRPRRARSSSGRPGRGRAGGGPCRGRAPRDRARAPRACPRRPRSARGRGIPRR